MPTIQDVIREIATLHVAQIRDGFVVNEENYFICRLGVAGVLDGVDFTQDIDIKEACDCLLERYPILNTRAAYPSLILYAELFKDVAVIERAISLEKSERKRAALADSRANIGFSFDIVNEDKEI